eukprot:RCo053140
MDGLPEAPHHGAVLVVAIVPAFLLQAVEVQIGASTDQQLQLFGAKHRQDFASANLQEAPVEGLKLTLYGILQEVLHVEMHVLLPVGRREGADLPSGLQRDLLQGAVDLSADRERALKSILHRQSLRGVLLKQQQRVQAPVQVWVQVPHVSEVYLHPKHLLVHCHGKADVQDDRVVDGQPKHDPDQPELIAVLKGVGIEPVLPRTLVVCEHPILRVQQLLAQELEELFLHPALIHAILPNEFDLQGLLQVLQVNQGLLQSRLDNIRAVHAHHTHQVLGTERGKPTASVSQAPAQTTEQQAGDHRTLDLTLLSHGVAVQHHRLGGRVENERKPHKAEVVPVLDAVLRRAGAL